MRIFAGTILRTADITTLLQSRTKVVASPIPMPLTALEEVASEGHMPRISTRTGFSFQIPFKNSSESFISHSPF